MVFDRLTRQIWEDLPARLPSQRKTERDRLAVLVDIDAVMSPLSTEALGLALGGWCAAGADHRPEYDDPA